MENKISKDSYLNYSSSLWILKCKLAHEGQVIARDDAVGKSNFLS